MMHRPVLAMCIATLGLGCGAPPQARPSGAARKTPPPALAPASGSAAATPPPAASASPGPVDGPSWRVVESLPASLAIDGKVEEWQSLGAARKGWMVVQSDRVVIAGAAPAGAASIEVSLSLGPRDAPSPRILDSSGRIEPMGCGGSFKGDSTCTEGLAQQEAELKALFDATLRTYVIQGGKVTIDGKAAAASKAAASTDAATAWFELEVPLAELPALHAQKVRNAGVRVRAAGDTRTTEMEEVQWKTPVALGGDSAILAGAVLSLFAEDNRFLFPIVDLSAQEPAIRTSVVLPGIPAPTAVQKPLSTPEVAAKAGDVELLRYDHRFAQAIATRKAGKVIDAFAVPTAPLGHLRRVVARGDVIDVAYDKSLPLEGVPTGIDDVDVGVARVEPSGRIVPDFAVVGEAMSTGSTPFADNGISRFGLRGQRWTGSGFAPTSIVWRYDPKSRTYEEVEARRE